MTEQTNGYGTNGSRPDVEAAHPAHGPASRQAPRPLRELLRRLRVFAADPPGFDPAGAPGHPLTLFADWLDVAVRSGVLEPHAMTLSTCGADGRPDARTLILKDLTESGFWFATSSDSAKGRQLAANPAASLTFYWPQLGRQIRIRGRVAAASGEASAADFRARSVGARAVALASDASAPLASRAQCSAAVAAARTRLQALPDLVPTLWTLCLLRPEEVEFWQADRDREHIRLRYTGRSNRWSRGLLWP